MGLSCLLAAGAGLVRLLPWLLAPEVPLRVIWPFARILASSAVDVAVIVGLPLGVGVAAAIAAERGELRAVAALGMAPHAVAARLLAAALLPASLALTSPLITPREAPGVLARGLVAAGRKSCSDRDRAPPSSVAVPLVGVTWLCFPGVAPRVVGHVPGALRGAWFSADDLTVSDDLAGLGLHDARLAVPRAGDAPRVSVAAAEVHVRGLSAWSGASAPGTRWVHALAVAVSGVGATFAAVAWVLVLRRSTLLHAVLLAAAAGGAMLALLSAVERASGPGPRALLACAVLAFALGGASTVPRVWRRVSSDRSAATPR